MIKRPVRIGLKPFEDIAMRTGFINLHRKDVSKRVKIL
jgi:hypothetical protein